VIHRDVKPGNVLFDDAGHVKIVDFGLALLTMGGSVTAEEIWATPYYVPPEALDGKEEDFRSDIYALGATLYHALSGKPPLPPEAKTTREVRKAKEHIPPLAEVAPWLNPGTCSLVENAMAFRPEDRFASYAEMEDAWNTAFQMMRGNGAEEPIHSQERVRRRVKNNSRVMGGIVLAIVVLIAMAVGVSMWVAGSHDSKVSDLTEEGGSDPSSEVRGLKLSQEKNEHYSPEMAERVSRLIRKSHTFLKQKKYTEAQDQFMMMIHDPDIKEPLPSWAKIEFLMAAWLGGDAMAVDQAMADMKERQKSKNEGQPEKLQKLEKKLIGFKVISEKGEDVGTEPMAVIQLMAMALKNWELGAWDAAVPFFEKVRKHPLPNHSPLMVYQELAQRHLNDYKTLKPLCDGVPPKTLDEAESQINQLKVILAELETQGRARFFVRVRQLRLHRQIKQMRAQALAQEEQKSHKRSTYADVQPEFKKLLANAKFAGASELLQSVHVTEDQKDVRDAWLYLTDSASAFLGLLEGGIPQGGVTLLVKEWDDHGEAILYQKVISGKPGGLILLRNKEEVFVPWAKIEPESVVAIFKKIFAPSLRTLKGQQYTEMAICYTQLVGMNDLARSVALKLSKENAGFKKRWNQAMQALGL
jgi:hypothetical protein